MLLTVVALVAVLAASDSFLDPNNIINILRSIAIVTVIAVGVSISLTVGGFDLRGLHGVAGERVGHFAFRLARLRHYRVDCNHSRALHAGRPV